MARELAAALHAAQDIPPELKGALAELHARVQALEAERAQREAEHLEVTDRLVRLMKRVQQRLKVDAQQQDNGTSALHRAKWGS